MVQFGQIGAHVIQIERLRQRDHVALILDRVDDEQRRAFQQRLVRCGADLPHA